MPQRARGSGDYGSFAEDYDIGRPIFPRWIFTEIARFLDRSTRRSRATMNVLDIACGTGVATRQLHAYGFNRVIGADRDSRMIRVAGRPESEIVYLTAPIENLPFADKTFDLVTAFGGLYWFGRHAQWSFDLERVLRPGALFAAVDEAHLNLPEEFATIVHEYAPYRTPVDIDVTSAESVLLRSRFRNVEPLTYLTYKEQIISFTVQQMYHYYLTGSSRGLISERRIENFKRDVFEFCRRQANPKGIIRRRFAYSLVLARAH